MNPTEPRLKDATVEYLPKTDRVKVSVSGLNSAEMKLAHGYSLKHGGSEGKEAINTRNGSLILNAEFKTVADARHYLRDFEVRTENAKAVPHMDFTNGNVIQQQLDAAGHAQFAARSPQLDATLLDKGVIRLTLSRLQPNHGIAAMDALDTLQGHIEPMPGATEVQGDTMTLDFANAKDATNFYHTLRKRVHLSENPHDIEKKIDTAANSKNPVFEVEGKKTGIYVTITNAPKNIIGLTMPVLQHISHLTDMVVTGEDKVMMSFPSAKDAKQLHRDLLSKMKFSEGNHVIYNKINEAAEKYRELSNQVTV